eukprot:TRINITY_DN2958_c0_g1_i5.p1 TRINITY_DN2958_c0_g1~~TRINITY_DN2958_c0_g1_i5.p1  ORF type:complete len:731 (-),score=141.57 TRINITY_DN2958_c0_g1_i5:2250-4229(-)
MVAELPLSPTCTMRPIRDRMPTPFAPAQAMALAAEQEASVQFSDAVTTVVVPEVPESVPEVGNRSVRDRIATPFVQPASPSTSLEDRRVVLAPELCNVEEVEPAEPSVQLRSSRNRMPTPAVRPDELEAFEEDGSRRVRIFPAAEVEAIPSSGQGRSSRERIATPFVSEEHQQDQGHQDRTVHFCEVVSTEVLPVTGERRPSRSRVATPFFGETEAINAQTAADADDEEVARNSKWGLSLSMDQETRTVSFQPETADIVAITPMGEMRPVRRKSHGVHAAAANAAAANSAISTPSSGLSFFTEAQAASKNRSGSVSSPAESAFSFGFEDVASNAGPATVEAAQDRSVSFEQEVSLGHAASSLPSSGGKSIRERQATGFISSESAEDVSDANYARAVSFDDDASPGQSASYAPLAARSVRERTPTGYVTGLMQNETAQATDGKSVSFGHGLGVGESASTSSTAAGKLIRERIPTGFVHEDVHAVGAEDITVGAAANGRSVSFGGDVGVVESASCAPSVARSVRERTPTGRISGDALPEISDRSVSFRADVAIGEAASTLGSSGARPVRERTPTGFIGAETAQVVEDRSVVFSGDVCVGESASTSTAAGKLIRERIPTGFVHEDVHAVGAEDITVGAAANGRSVSFGADVSIGESASCAEM